jgi:methylated-DNA-[protein]-cysteine S-methyltransferase
MWTVTDSPVGELRLVAAGGALVGIDFLGTLPVEGEESVSVARHAARAGALPMEERDDADPLLREAAGQLAAYFSGGLREFDLPLAPAGTPFQRSVWEQLRQIRYGETASYGEVARRLGLTGHGARAVGLANGRNPIPVVVPCHRVVGASGSLTGYGGGIARKQQLLDLESDRLF